MIWLLMHQWCAPQLIVSVLTLFGVMTIPDIVREGGDFVQRLKSENAWVVVLEKLRHGIGCVPMGHLIGHVMLGKALVLWLLRTLSPWCSPSSPHQQGSSTARVFCLLLLFRALQ